MSIKLHRWLRFTYYSLVCVIKEHIWVSPATRCFDLDCEFRFCTRCQCFEYRTGFEITELGNRARWYRGIPASVIRRQRAGVTT